MIEKKKVKIFTFVILICMVAVSSQDAWGIVSKSIPYRVNYIRPAEETVKIRNTNLSIHLEFKSGSHLLEPRHRGNWEELGRIDSLMNLILNDPFITLDTISIMGFSSPEGLYQENEHLSKARATAVKEYLTDRYSSVLESRYRVSFGGENWNDLYNMVLHSDMPDKMRVLEIIATVDVMKGREVQLMVLSRGVPYRYMLKHFFPALRKVDLNFIYNVRNFNLDEAKGVYETNPKALSLAEIFNLASQYPQDSKEFRSMMISSAGLFPESDIAQLNAAIASVFSGDTLTAASHLAQISKMHSGEYYNVLGVNQALSGRIDEAIATLKEGILEQSADAEYNLLLLRKPEAITIREIVRDTVYIREMIKQPLQPTDEIPQWALKVNMLYGLALQPNIEAEVYFAKRWSLNMEYQVAWWSRPAKHQYYQYMHIGIEGRYWFKRNNSFSGHHLGLYAGGGYYDLSPGHKRNSYQGYQGEFAVAAGLSYGYAWRLKRSLWMEAGIGLGYVTTEYRRYQYIDQCYVYQSTERLQFLGPTKLRLTFIWRPKFRSKK